MIYLFLINVVLILGEMVEDICKRVFNIFVVNKKINVRLCYGEF